MAYEDYKWKKVEMGDTWNFEEEEKCFGKYIGVEKDVGPNRSNLYKIMVENGDIVSMWGSAVIDSRMEQIPISYIVSIKYLGREVNESTGREYKSYDIHSAGPAPKGFGVPVIKEEKE